MITYAHPISCNMHSASKTCLSPPPFPRQHRKEKKQQGLCQRHSQGCCNLLGQMLSRLTLLQYMDMLVSDASTYWIHPSRSLTWSPQSYGHLNKTIVNIPSKEPRWNLQITHLKKIIIFHQPRTSFSELISHVWTFSLFLAVMVGVSPNIKNVKPSSANQNITLPVLEVWVSSAQTSPLKNKKRYWTCSFLQRYIPYFSFANGDLIQSNMNCHF